MTRRIDSSRARRLDGSLQSLVWPVDARAFHTRHWNRRPFAFHGQVERVEPILELLPSLNIVELGNHFGRSASATLVDATGQIRYFEAPPAQLSSFYEAGMSLYLADFHHNHPALIDWFSRLAGHLAVAERGGVDLFLADRDAGTRCHFDTAHTFTVQLAGTKTWRIAPNHHLAAPSINWSIGDPIPDELLLYVRGTLPTSLPTTARRVAMRPGSVLYLPPGYWHETGQSRQSLSLVFRFNPTSWLDLTIAALRDCLLRDDAWRRAPGSDGDRLPAHDLTRLVEDLLDGARPVGHRRLTARTPLRRCINATLGITTSRGRTLVDLAVVRLGATARREQLTVTAALARVCRWIAQTQTAFTSRDVAAAFARVPRTKIAGLLTRLVRAGYLRALPVR